MKVLFSPDVQLFYYELEIILFEQGYFSYEESAHAYVDGLIFDIKNDLPKLKHYLICYLGNNHTEAHYL